MEKRLFDGVNIMHSTGPTRVSAPTDGSHHQNLEVSPSLYRDLHGWEI